MQIHDSICWLKYTFSEGKSLGEREREREGGRERDIHIDHWDFSAMPTLPYMGITVYIYKWLPRYIVVITPSPNSLAHQQNTVIFNPFPIQTTTHNRTHCKCVIHTRISPK